MALDEATTAFLTEAAKAGGPALHEMTPQEAREMSAGLSALYGPGPALPSVEDVAIEVEGGTVPARVFRPEAATGVIAYLHGGGWVVGTLSGFDTLCRQLASRTGRTIVLVEYRKAPEHRFPTALEDARAALAWVDSRRDELAAPGELVVAGDSAGGNLAAVLAQQSGQDGTPTVDFQVLVYPVTAADFETDSYRDPANELMLGREAMAGFWDHYVPDEQDRKDPAAAPLLGDVAHVAPALVVLAEHDVLRSEGAAYAEKLRDAGVPVEEHVVPGQMHGFFTFPNVLPGAAAGMDLVVDALARRASPAAR
ncbi:alpha/beta hydrolase [Nocardioides ochotonae]|uniref:alpha/beta hydrolase n=1 Tax=Nocardioides ochotonae TaxID=2685869 RepID=UPI00140771D1|nr:alpha/beta hydrolase [Nocardioides ochotonae]